MTKRVDFEVQSVDESSSFQVRRAHTVAAMHLKKRPVTWNGVLRRWPHLRRIEFPTHKANDVTVIIGYDHPDLLDVFETRRDPLRSGSPRAILTSFGWCVVGPVTGENNIDKINCNRITVSDPETTFNKLVEDFFLNDTFGTKPDVKLPIGAEEKRALNILENTTRLNNGRYEVGLLWRADDINLPDNRSTAMRRLLSLEKRLIRDSQLRKRYIVALEEYIQQHHARKLTAEEMSSGIPGRIWYIPHHPVLNPNKPGKCRPVFDASAEHKGISLNSQLLKGPDLLTNLVGVLIRFRQYPVALSADIVKMFHQVRVRPEDASAFRFLWRRPGSSEPPDTYQMDVQIFGAVSSPSICAHSLQQAAKDCGPDSAAVLKQVVDHFYVDNWLTSFRTVQEA